jgi:CP family cyanate transporter-like MFS transporter
MNYQNLLKEKNAWLMIIALILIGINLRPSMAAIGPLLTQIQESIPASYSLIALLTMLPVLAIGLAMFWGIRFAAWIGEFNAIVLGLVVIGLASFARLYTNGIMDLILTAVVAGLGISIIQAVMPSIIKSRYPNSVPLLMGVYITAIMGGAALAASTVTFIEVYTGNWRAALAIWAVLAIFALLVWFAVRYLINQKTDEKLKPFDRESFVSRPRAWLLGIFFGLGTASYTCILAWLPPFYLEQGWQETHAGLLLAYLTGMEVISGLTIPVLASYRLDRRAIVCFLLLLIVAGFIGLLLAPTAYPILWSSLLGLGIGGIFPLSLIITMDHLDSPSRAGKLTAFVQGIGYIIAAFSPLVAGYLRDTFASFDYAWLLLMMVTIAMIVMALRFNPKNYSIYFK